MPEVKVIIKMASKNKDLQRRTAIEESEDDDEKKPKFEKKYHESLMYKPPGVRFFKEASKCSIIRTEYDDPFQGMELYELGDVHIKPLDTSKIPPEAWPYPNCLFVSENKALTLLNV